MNINKIASYIDQTLLKPDVSYSVMNEFLKESQKYPFHSVCINPFWVRYAKEKLEETNIIICTVVGFPLGANTTKIKISEAADAVNNGAIEIDMVMNIGTFKSKEYKKVSKEISLIKKKINNNILKVIVETALLDQKEKQEIAKLVMDSGADYIKTSTGFASGGAAINDISLFKSIIKDKIKIKASGGIKTFDFFTKLLDAGVDRIGTGSGIEIIENK